MIRLLAGWRFDGAHSLLQGWCTHVLWLLSSKVADFGILVLECDIGEWATVGLEGHLPKNAFLTFQAVVPAA